jgi:DNA-binding NarL/FixJ family response regulator
VTDRKFTLVLAADEDDDARDALASLLMGAGYDVVEAKNGEEAIRAAHEAEVSLAILEVVFEDLSGYEVCRAIREEVDKDLPIIFLSGTRTESYDKVAGLLIGADDYVSKPYAPDELLARVRAVLRRIHVGESAPDLGLTPRELEVLLLLAEGLTPEEVAARLFISAKTVGTHVEHIFSKLGVRNRAHAVAIAYREGLVGTPS